MFEPTQIWLIQPNIFLSVLCLISQCIFGITIKSQLWVKIIMYFKRINIWQKVSGQSMHIADCRQGNERRVPVTRIHRHSLRNNRLVLRLGVELSVTAASLPPVRRNKRNSTSKDMLLLSFSLGYTSWEQPTSLGAQQEGTKRWQ